MRQFSRRNALAQTLVLSIAIVALGCDDGLDRAAVEGTIKVDGVLLEQGSIALIPTAGTTGPSAGATIEHGEYSIPADKGPMPGGYRVEIKSMRKTGRQIVDEHQPPPNNRIDEMEQFIPPQYNADSTLSVQIKAGKNRDVNFDLQIKGSGHATP